MTCPISIKTPNRMILEYDDCRIELAASKSPFKYFIFYADEATMKRLEEKGVLGGPAEMGCSAIPPAKFPYR